MSREHYFCLQYKYLHSCQCIITVTETKCIRFLGHMLTVVWKHALVTFCYNWSSDFVIVITFHSFIHSCMHIVHDQEHMQGWSCLFVLLFPWTAGLNLVVWKHYICIMTLEATPSSYCPISKVAMGQIFLQISLVPVVPPMLYIILSVYCIF